MDHVLLYDNNENGAAQATELADFRAANFLTLHTISGQAQQLPAYQHCLMHYRDSFAWLAALDIDEFLAVEDADARQLPPAQQLKAVLRDFRFLPGAHRPRTCLERRDPSWCSLKHTVQWRKPAQLGRVSVLLRRSCALLTRAASQRIASTLEITCLPVPQVCGCSGRLLARVCMTVGRCLAARCSTTSAACPWNGRPRRC